MSLWSRLLARSVRELTRLACLLGLAGLAIMVYSIIVPEPLPVILAMSLGQLISLAALGAFGVAILVDATRGPDDSDEASPSDEARTAGDA